MQPHSIIPLGLCQCGCGQKTSLAKLNNTARGNVKGRPVRFVVGHKTPPLEQRFWNKVQKINESNGCWLWTGATTKGYGNFTIPISRPVRAHRFSWELHNGPIPEGWVVCHSCDALYPIGDISYRRCVNPTHLFLATNEENSADMVRKGRVAKGKRAPRLVHPESYARLKEKRAGSGLKGEANAAAKLTDQQVKAIREAFAQGTPIYKLALEYTVERNTIGKIVHRKTWKHVP